MGYRIILDSSLVGYDAGQRANEEEHRVKQGQQSRWLRWNGESTTTNTKRGRARVKLNIALLLTDDQDERSLSLVPGVEEAIGAAEGGR